MQQNNENIFQKNFRQLLLFETVRVGRRTNSRSTEPTEYCCKSRRKIETDQQTDFKKYGSNCLQRCITAAINIYSNEINTAVKLHILTKFKSCMD